MASAYPGGLDSFATTKQDDTDSKTGADLGVSTTVGDHAQHHNDLADAVNKIESELGVDPAGAALTVRERFESEGLKASCVAASTANIAIPPGGTTLTVDTVTLANGDRVLLKDQTTPSQNGIYVVGGVGTSVTLTRATDADTGAKLAAPALTPVASRNTIWQNMSTGAITLGTTAIRYSRVYPPYQSLTSVAQGEFFTTGKLESVPRQRTPLSSQALLVSGTIRVFPLGILRAGEQIVDGVQTILSSAAATVTNSWGGIAHASTRVVLARSGSSTVAPAANTWVNFSLTYTPDVDTPVIGFVMYQATTVPGLYGISHSAANVESFGSPVVNGTSGTGQTTPPAVGSTLAAITGGAQIPWAYLS